MDSKPTAMPEHPVTPPLPGFQSVSQHVKGRILGGLLLVMPILITLWVFHWLYSSLEVNVIDPLALLVLWKVQGRSTEALPPWFETYAAPLIAIGVVLILLYCLGFFLHSRLRRGVDWVLLRLPVVSVVYNGVWNVFQALDRQRGQQRSQRVVLISFPHPGMKAAAFVTAQCRDLASHKVILCVYVPQSPLPTNGHLLLIPEEDATELNWSSEQTLQTLISGGFTAPRDVNYFKAGHPGANDSIAAPVMNDDLTK